MDDALELPNAPPAKPDASLEPEENDQSSDEEDGGLDWTKLLPAALRPVIPKRGEKEYEPRAGGGSNLQLHVLDRSRNAMFETLKATRTTSSKVISYAIWHPPLARAEVTLFRGIHFSNMGHSAPRQVRDKDGLEKLQKRMELLPEEALYLIERGTLFCWKSVGSLVGVNLEKGLENILGAPMTVQQAYAEMIGTEDMTLEKFQVFSYLKRLGYVVTRTDPPSPHYPTPAPLVNTTGNSILSKIRGIFNTCARAVASLFSRFNWWHPLKFTCLGNEDKTYGHIFRSLRIMPSGHSVPLQLKKPISDSSPYKIFYNIYKPSTPFKKSNPGPPDFQMVVVNARTAPMPTLQELTRLFDISPELPPPAPRQRFNPLQRKQAPITEAASQPSTPTTSPTLFGRLSTWLFPSKSEPTPATGATKPRPPNPFVMLKSGKKMTLIAAVDSGNISFFRFSQGEFSEWPMA